MGFAAEPTDPGARRRHERQLPRPPVRAYAAPHSSKQIRDSGRDTDEVTTRLAWQLNRASFTLSASSGVNGLTHAPFSHKIAAMTSRISHTTVDAIDAYAQSVWWSKVLDFIEDPDDPNEPGHELCPIMSRDRSQVLLFITVPDGQKKLKNRLHFDLRPVNGTRDQEVERLLALGASQVGDFRRPDGRGWITLTDPEGNEFSPIS